MKKDNAKLQRKIQGIYNSKKLKCENIKRMKNNMTNAMKRKTSIDNKRKTNKKRKMKQEAKIGTWNVKSMLKPGKMEEVAREMLRYKIDILALQEIRWKAEGRIDKNNYTFLYGGETKQGKNGTGFMIKKKFKERIMEYRRINGRISVLRVKNKIANITIVNGYAPTEESGEDEKDAFYEELEKVCEETNKHDTLILLGDFNGKIGKEDYLSNVAGKHTIHNVTSNNGHRLCNLAEEMCMYIMSTKYEHKPDHKVTWLLPGKTTGNQIDHVLISKKRENMMHDVRSYRGANVDSDHMLIIAKMTLRKIDIKKKKTNRIKWKVDELNIDEIRSRYEKEVDQQLLKKKETNDIEIDWCNIKNSLTESAEKIIGKKYRETRKEWIDSECIDAIKEKNIARLKWLRTKIQQEYENYKQKRKESTKLIQQKRKQWIDNMMIEIENDSYNNTKLYQCIRKQNRKRPVVNINKEEWERYFRELSTTNDDTESYENGTEEEDERGEFTEIPSEEECNKAIEKLKQNKAAGPDNICSELIKKGGSGIKERIRKLIVQIWQKEKMPEEWNTGLIVPILKKGNPRQCKNYRGITLLNICYKILTNIMLGRIKCYAEQSIGEYQNGFKSGRSTVDAIHAVKQIVEKCCENNIELHIVFIDFKQAFDSLERNVLLRDMKEIGIPNKLIRLTRMTMRNSKANVLTCEGISKEVEINKGVRQGDGLSATLFNIALEGVVKASSIEGTLRERARQIVAYADDVAVVAKNKRILKQTIQNIATEARKRGLEINQQKTKYMKISRDKPTCRQGEIKLGEFMFEEVENFRYLGNIISGTNYKNTEIEQKIQAGHRAFNKYKQYIINRKISKRLKLKIYKTAIRPVVTYAAETVCLTKKEEERLKIFERKIIRKIYGPVKIGREEYRRLYNKEIEEILEDETIVRRMKATRIKWFGHIYRRDSNSVIRKLTEWKPFGNRKRGRPKVRWEEQVKEDLGKIGILEWRNKVKDRNKWKEIVKKAKTHNNL